MIDTHTHIYLDEFDQDRESMIQKAKQAGVEYLMLPNIEASSFNQLESTVAQFGNSCKAMMGLHPCSVKENYKAELEFVRRELFEKKSMQYFGVGEIGLDYY